MDTSSADVIPLVRPQVNNPARALGDEVPINEGGLAPHGKMGASPLKKGVA